MIKLYLSDKNDIYSELFPAKVDWGSLSVVLNKAINVLFIVG